MTTRNFDSILVALLLLTGIKAYGQECNRMTLTEANSQWMMCRADDVKATPEALSQNDFDTRGWQKAIVPGTVLTSLVANGVFPDPYFGTNNRIEDGLIPDISTTGRGFYTYWFRTEFTAPTRTQGQRLWLQVDGINYRGDIWVNGSLLSTMKGMFKTEYIEITDYVKSGQRATLAVLVNPVDMPGSRIPKSWGAAGEFQNGGNGEIGLNTTQLMTVGWDFTYNDGIRDRNTGIWRPIHLVTTGPIDMRHAFVKSTLSHPDYDRAQLTVSVEITNPSTDNRPVGCEVKGIITPIQNPDKKGRQADTIVFSKKTEIGRGMTTTLTFSPEEFRQLCIDHPQLWWPKNKGEQNLYELELTCMVNGDVSDRLTTKFGIREVATTRETPDHSKLFIVNGRRIFVKGSNWLPEAMLRGNDRRTEAELLMTAQSGVNLLRLWGGGIAESDRFYEMCDELGIMVWQEFWMTGDTRHPQDEANYLDNVASTVKRIRNHPSIVFYVASNESSEVTGTRELLEKTDGTRPFQQQSECDGVHDGSPYKQVNPMQHYENTASDRGSRVDGFNPEYGAPTLPLAESLRQMMPAAQLWPIDKKAWDYMDGGGFHLMTSLYHEMVEQYGSSSNIEEYAKKAQLVGAMNAKSIWDVWNYNQLDSGDRFCSGLLFWYHNSSNPQVCARMWDYYLEPTAALYHTMHALEPVHPMFDYLKNTVSVSNDLTTDFTGGQVTATVYDLNSRKLYQHTAKADVGSESTQCDLFVIPFEDMTLTPVHFVHLSLSDKNGKTVAQNFYWRSTSEYKGRGTLTGPTTAGFESLSEMPEARLSGKKKVEYDAGTGMMTLRVSLKNTSKNIAFFNQLHLFDEQGQAVRPAYYSDNFITLLPGEETTITIKATMKSEQHRLTLEGWNTKKKTI